MVLFVIYLSSVFTFYFIVRAKSKKIGNWSNKSMLLTTLIALIPVINTITLIGVLIVEIIMSDWMNKPSKL